MRALITGGTGFVAQHLAAALHSAGHFVRATRRKSGAAEEGTRTEWIDVPDIGPQTDWSAALAGIDVVFHLAGVAHRIAASQAELAAEYERVNAQGTLQLARSAVARGGRMRIVLLSSIGAVCTTSNAVVTALTEPHPDSVYGASKLHAERLLEEACRGSVVEWCAIRAPLVYGRGAPGNLARLVRLVDRGLPLPLGRATARRSLVYVGNLVDALMAAATGPRASSQVMLVADGQAVSVAELLRMIGALRGRRVRLLPVPVSLLTGIARGVDALRGGADDRNDRLAKSVELLFGGLELDTRDTQALLQWQAPYSLRDGLAGTFGVEARPTA